MEQVLLGYKGDQERIPEIDILLNDQETMDT